MSKERDALKLAMEALEEISSHYMSLPKKGCMALAAIEEVLAQPEQEPVACQPRGLIDIGRIFTPEKAEEPKPVAWKKKGAFNFCNQPPVDVEKWIPLYTFPPASKPLPLTDEQRKYIVEMWRGGNWTAGDIIDAVEAAHGIKE